MICIRSVGDWGLNLAFHFLSMNDFVLDRNILLCFRSRFRCPLTTAPVRTEGLFQRPTVVILHMGKTAPEAASEVFQSFHRKNFRRGFLLSPDNSEVYLCPTKVLALRGWATPKSRPFFKLYMDTDRELTDITDRKPRTPGYKYSFRLNEEQIFALTSCFARPERSTTAACLSSKGSSTKSSSSLNTNLRRCSPLYA